MGLAGRCHPGDLALGLSKASHAGFLAQEQGDGAGNKLSILFWANGIACVVGECNTRRYQVTYSNFLYG